MSDRDAVETPIRVAMSGTGKMGAQLLQAFMAADETVVVGVLEKFSEGESFLLPDGGEVPLRQSPEGVADLGADVVVDFSNASWTAELLPAAVAAGGG